MRPPTPQEQLVAQLTAGGTQRHTAIRPQKCPTPATRPDSTTPPATCLGPGPSPPRRQSPAPDAASATSAWTYTQLARPRSRKWPSPPPACASPVLPQSAL